MTPLRYRNLIRGLSLILWAGYTALCLGYTSLLDKEVHSGAE
jgi:hypothetical protein